MTEDQKRIAADSYVTNHPDSEVRRMCGHYFRAFMAGCDITKAENDSIEAHNKALLETISRNEEENERLTKEKEEWRADSLQLAEKLDRVNLENHKPYILEIPPEVILRNKIRELESDLVKAKDHYEIARLEGMIGLYVRMDSKSGREATVTNNGKWIPMEDYIGGVKVALDMLKERNKPTVKPEQTAQTSNPNKPDYIASTNVTTDEMPKSWIQLWEQIEIWYGDPLKRETGEQILNRLRKTFELKVGEVEQPTTSGTSGEEFKIRK